MGEINLYSIHKSSNEILQKVRLHSFVLYVIKIFAAEAERRSIRSYYQFHAYCNNVSAMVIKADDAIRVHVND